MFLLHKHLLIHSDYLIHVSAAKLIASTDQKIVTYGITDKKTLKRNPDAKCMVCTWLKNSLSIDKAKIEAEITKNCFQH